MQEGGNGFNFRQGEIKFRHAFIRSAVLHDLGDKLAILVVQHGLAADQIGTLFTAAGIGSVAKAAVRAERRAPTLNHGRVRRRPHRVVRMLRWRWRRWRRLRGWSRLRGWTCRLLGYHGGTTQR